MLKYNQQTHHSAIFSGSYWGSCSGRADESVIKNRNNFVEKFDIVYRKSLKDTPKYILRIIGYQSDNKNPRDRSRELDHIELYQTKDKSWVIITSPYLANKEFMDKYGYEKYDNLYSVNAETYCKILKTKDNNQKRHERYIVAIGSE